MADQASISTDILARYAADAALEVEGVASLAESSLPGRRAVRISGRDGAVRVELHLVADWGTPLATLGRHVQGRVREYLGSMADVEPATVDVVVDGVSVGSTELSKERRPRLRRSTERKVGKL